CADAVTPGLRVVEGELVARAHDVEPLGQVRPVALQNVGPAGSRFPRHVMQTKQVADLVSSRMLLPSRSSGQIAVCDTLDVVRSQQRGVGAEMGSTIRHAYHAKHGMRVMLAVDQLDEQTAQQIPPPAALLRPDELVVAVRRRQEESSIPGGKHDA